MVSHILARISSNLQPNLGRCRRERVVDKKSVATDALRKTTKKPSKVHFNSCTAVASDASSASKPVSVQLPTSLSRPVFQEVTQEALVAVDANCAGVSAQFLRDSLPTYSAGWLESIAAMKPISEMPQGVLPTEVSIMLEGVNPSDAPSHMLAVRAPNSSKATLFPCHSLVLAANCSRLSPFTSTCTPAASEDSVALPVRFITLPDPATFAYLLSFLYTKSASALYCAPFLPMRVSKDAFNVSERAVAAQLAKSCNTPTLMKSIAAVWGLWSNACALGVVDELLWDTIDRLWRTLLIAVSLVPASNARIAKRVAC